MKTIWFPLAPRPDLPLLHLLLLASVEGLSPHRDRLKAATASSQPFLPRRILNSSGHTHTHTLTRENYVCACVCVIVCVIYVYVSCRCFCLRISFCRNRIRIRIRFKCEFISTKYYKSQRHTHTHTHRSCNTHTVTPRHTHTHWQLTHASSHMEKGHFWGHRIYINPYGCPSPFLRVLLQSPHHLCSYSSPLYTYATTAWACDLGSVFFGHVPK